MTQNLPKLDPIPTTKPHDYSYREIKVQMAKPKVSTVQRLEEWHNPNQKYLTHRDQKNGGTCTGQAAAYGAGHNYMKLTGDIPTPEQLAQLKRNVIDSLGSLVDILPPHEFSSECAYQMGREVGHIVYPSGGDIRFVARAMRDYGICLESQWHSDKERLKVWMYPPGPRVTPDGGVSPEEAAAFASLHRSKGWAMVGTPDGDATWDEICDAIYEKGWVMCAIPIYTNYHEIQGQEIPVYPRPNGEIDGFHAQIVDGYTPTELDIEHSWWGFCGQHGKLTKEYYTSARDMCVWLVWLDDEETIIAKEHYHSLTIQVKDAKTYQPVLADVYINNIKVGVAPQKVAIEPGKEYQLEIKKDKYIDKTQTYLGSDSDIEIIIPLDPIIPIIKTPWELILEFIYSLIKRLFGIK